MRYRRSLTVDVLVGLSIIALAAAAIASIIAPDSRSGLIPILGVGGLVVIALGLLVAQLVTRPDHLRALQSDMILRVANETLEHLHQKPLELCAPDVCRIILARASEVAAVEIADQESVLGFAGIGEDHHRAGERSWGPAAGQPFIDSVEAVMLDSQEDLGCTRDGCLLRAAIVAPLVVRGAPTALMKFYYTTPRLLNETQLTTVQGLVALLSTQLEFSQLERQTELARVMELRALQSQINPHFLFNTINTIAACIRTDPTEARRLMRLFGAFYRRTLEQQSDFVTLSVELDYVAAYLELEHARFGDRLCVINEIDERLSNMPVPAFLLQPLVENAIQHGTRPDGTRLCIKVTARLDTDRVLLTVEDDGVGITQSDMTHVLEPGFGKGLGIALPNVRDRLRGYFGPGSAMTIDSTPGSGTRITLVISPIPSAIPE